MSNDSLMKQMRDDVLYGEIEDAEALARRVVEEGIDPLEAIEKGFSAGIEEAGERFHSGEFFLPELIAAAEAMKAALGVLEPELAEGQQEQSSLGLVVIGTVAGDIHDIGKSIVSSLLSAAGFQVVDVGVDISRDKFVEEVTARKPDILGLSALLTTTMPEQKDVIEALNEAGIRDSVKVMIGGAPVNEQWAEEIGADCFAEDAIAAVDKAKELLGASA